ncbi:MAG: acyl-ACP--UDP-N-acetylglucosamine O-acyltransferase [Sedimentisphaerales bacterium]|jgi:UDP-N-acetylglucosamine acyltransferase|nr:acyl-ACP--UDP-N-acetylglucosamine O-acyltransferase [Sedimentisphaerales bacterium]
MSSIHPTAVIDKEAIIDPQAQIGPYCIVGRAAQIGAGTVLRSHVVIGDEVIIGKDNVFYPYCVIGSRPQILGFKEQVTVGSVVIGDGNTFREYVTIHRSKYSGCSTKIGNHNLLMVGAHVGHDCVLEDHIVMTNYVQVAGHCHIETGAWLSGLVGIHQFVTIGRWAYAAGMTSITRDVPPFVVVSGSYPTKVRGVNVRGLIRAGLNREQQKRIIAAFKELYRKGGPLLTKAQELAQQDGLDENVRAMVEAIHRSSQHRYGRFLECTRNARS